MILSRKFVIDRAISQGYVVVSDDERIPVTMLTNHSILKSIKVWKSLIRTYDDITGFTSSRIRRQDISSISELDEILRGITILSITYPKDPQ